jgi:WD40 repeat protein
MERAEAWVEWEDIDVGDDGENESVESASAARGSGGPTAKDISINVNNLLATSSGSTLHIWDATSYALMTSLAGSRDDDYGAVRCAVFSHDNSLLATGDTEGLVVIWDMLNIRNIVCLEHDQLVWSIVFPHYQTDTLYCLVSNSIIIWDLAVAQTKQIIPLNGFRANGLWLTCDDAKIVSRTGGALGVWINDESAGYAGVLLNDMDYSVVSMSPCHAEQISIASKDGEIMVWNLDIQQRIMTAHEPNSSNSQPFSSTVHCLCYSTDGSQLFSCSTDCRAYTIEETIKVFDLTSQQMRVVLDVITFNRLTVLGSHADSTNTLQLTHYSSKTQA